MKKWMQHLTGVIMGSVLALTLNGKACAEEPESASPDLPEPEIADGASVNSAAPAGEAPDAAPAEDSAAGEAEIAENEETIDEEETVEEENAVGTAVEEAAEDESGADAADSLPASEIPEEADDSPALLAKSAKAAATESASAELITVGDVSFDGTEDVFTGMSEDEDRNGIHHGWYWTADNQSLSLVYYAGADETISVKNGNLRIQAAGLNQVASIICDGVVDLIGTGILLVDDIDLGETGVFNILPNADIYGEDGGCVAVFRKQDDGSYLLINGSVPGILDEVYTLPEGVDLVVPEGSTLLMNSLVAVPDSDGGYTYYSGDEATGLTVSGWAPEVSGQLIISENSSLTVEKGATLAVCATPSANESGQTLMPCLDVAGSLELNEPITGGGLIRQREGGTVTGAGALSATELVLQDQDQLEAGLVAIGKTAGDSLGYAELVELAEAIYGTRFPASIRPVFILHRSPADGGDVTIDDENGLQTTVADVADISIIDSSTYSGQSLVASQLGATGCGILGGLSAGSLTLTEGDPTPILHGTPKAKPIAQHSEQQMLRIVVTENGSVGTYTLSVYDNTRQILDLGGGSVTVRMNFTMPADWDSECIYVVFLTVDGSLKAIPAVFNPVTGTLVFDSSLVGDFVVVCFDFEGEPFSEAFYKQLAELDAVKALFAPRPGRA